MYSECSEAVEDADFLNGFVTHVCVFNYFKRQSKLKLLLSVLYNTLDILKKYRIL